MGVGNILLLSQTAGYVLGFILALFLLIPMSINSHDFNGHCLLYATGSWNQSNGILYDISWGDSSLCNFSIVVAILSLILSLIQLIRLSLLLFQEVDSSWLASFLTLLLNIFLAFFILIGSSVLSGGFNEWCSMFGRKGSIIRSCEFADVIHFINDKKIHTEAFYIHFGMAQFGSWSLWLVWTCQVVLSSVKLYKYNQQESFITSMSRERQRLLQRVNRNSYDPVT